MTRLGLFPLDLVLLPTELVPLHIFEERYKELIGECLESSDEFGVVLADESDFHPTGTRAAVVDVVQRYEDGRMDILVEGHERFNVVGVVGGRAFVVADVEDLDDESDLPLAAESEAAIAAVERLAEAAGLDAPILDAADGSLSFRIAAAVGLEPEVKQELLEMTSERRRILRLSELLDAAAGVVERRRMIQERAAGNGHVG